LPDWVSLAASGASIAGLNLIYIIVTDKGPVISPSQIPLTTLSAGYVLHIVITVVVGVIIGIFIRARRDEKIKSNHPWIDLHQDTGDTSPRVGILTTSGQILEGDLYRYERSSDSQDLRLQNAEILVKGSESKYNLPDEGSVYIYGQQIEYVWFVSEIEDE
jgi:hypothetical protein